MTRRCARSCCRASPVHAEANPIPHCDEPRQPRGLPSRAGSMIHARCPAPSTDTTARYWDPDSVEERLILADEMQACAALTQDTEEMVIAHCARWVARWESGDFAGARADIAAGRADGHTPTTTGPTLARRDIARSRRAVRRSIRGRRSACARRPDRGPRFTRIRHRRGLSHAAWSPRCGTGPDRRLCRRVGARR